VDLKSLAEKLGLCNLTPQLEAKETAEVVHGYVSDLLSDVLGNAPRGSVLVTIQTHMNVVAVASHVPLAAVIFAARRLPDDDVRKKAVEEGIPLLSSAETSFDVVGRLYALGVRGPKP